MPPDPECFAACTPGLEPVLAAELAAMGREVVPEGGGVGFAGDMAVVQEANLRLRTASRVLVRVARFRARTFPELERHADRVDWGAWLRPGVAAEFEVTSRKSRLYHQRAISERLQQAVARAGLTAEPAGPPRQLFVVRVVRDGFTLSIDSSGELLHRRGYRLETAKAPLRETLTAAMLLGGGWSPEVPLWDPFCGSGTIPIEAALLARRIAPGLGRSFAFEGWPGQDRRAWDALRARVAAERLPATAVEIGGSDRDAGAVAAARANAERAGVAADVAFRESALSSVRARGEGGWIVTNPPYGVRIGEEARLRDLYATLGRLVGGPLAGWSILMLSASARLAGATGLRWHEVFRTMNGGIDVTALAHRAIARAGP